VLIDSKMSFALHKSSSLVPGQFWSTISRLLCSIFGLPAHLHDCTLGSFEQVPCQFCNLSIGSVSHITLRGRCGFANVR